MVFKQHGDFFTIQMDAKQSLGWRLRCVPLKTAPQVILMVPTGGNHWSPGIHPGHCEHVLAKHEIKTSNPYPEQVSRFVHRLMCIHHNVQTCKLFSHLWARGRVRVRGHSVWVNLSRGSLKLNTAIIFLGQKSHALTIN